MNLRKQHVTGFAIAALFLATGNLIHAQEQKPFSPALEQLRETVSERLQTVADQLRGTPVGSTEFPSRVRDGRFSCQVASAARVDLDLRHLHLGNCYSILSGVR